MRSLEIEYSRVYFSVKIIPSQNCTHLTTDAAGTQAGNVIYRSCILVLLLHAALSRATGAGLTLPTSSLSRLLASLLRTVFALPYGKVLEGLALPNLPRKA